jgi:hypothetical protein
MLCFEVPRNTGLDVGRRERLGRTVRKESGLQVLAGELADTPDHDLASLFVPLQKRAWTNA